MDCDREAKMLCRILDTMKNQYSTIKKRATHTSHIVKGYIPNEVNVEIV